MHDAWTAAAEQALEDEAFAPDVIVAAAQAAYARLAAGAPTVDRVCEHFGAAARLYETRRPTRLAIRLDAGAQVRLVDVGPASATVEVRTEATIGPERTPFLGLRRALRAYWTLRREGAGWVIAEIEPEEAGAHHEREAGGPDEIHDVAVIEAADTTGIDVVPLGVARALPDDAVVAARELALLDGRFDPDVIAACARRIARAWEEASGAGCANALLPLASPDAAAQLLSPVDRVVRGVRVNAVSLHRLRATHVPPLATVEVDLWAGRGPREADAVVFPRVGATRYSQWWRLALALEPAQPWQLVDAAVDALHP
jgi:hypothetical protein